MMPWAYPIVVGLAILVGAALSRRYRDVVPMTPSERLALGLGAFCGGMIGAKLPFLLADPEGLLSGRAWLENGKTLVFGLVGGYLGVEAVKWAIGLRIKTGDAFAVPVAAAVAVGRFSCFCAGCCYGRPTGLPWGVHFGDGVRRHPTQLYEAAFHAAAAAILAALLRRGIFRRQLIKLYLIAYMIYRFATEFLRPEPVVALGLTGYQWATLGLVPVFVVLWIRDRRAPAGSYATQPQSTRA